ncbi:MAG: hypothetical protein LBD23_02535 [Oscillospiraceae bacterium]|jgi:hypothetical protein|nr:hypothetical protein [Oscillospiraceae bacterium]
MKIISVLLSVIFLFSVFYIESPAQEPLVLIRHYIVEDNYGESGTYRIIKNENNFEKITIHGSECRKQTPQSTKEILRIPLFPDAYKVDGGFLLPSEIEGIVMDIPFNYFSCLESSARYFQMLLYNGWEITYFNATSLCVQIGLVNENGVKCRLLIYKDFLKVYCSLINSNA